MSDFAKLKIELINLAYTGLQESCSLLISVTQLIYMIFSSFEIVSHKSMMLEGLIKFLFLFFNYIELFPRKIFQLILSGVKLVHILILLLQRVYHLSINFIKIRQFDFISSLHHSIS